LLGRLWDASTAFDRRVTVSLTAPHSGLAALLRQAPMAWTLGRFLMLDAGMMTIEALTPSHA
jgi:hypothetical protein